MILGPGEFRLPLDSRLDVGSLELRVVADENGLVDARITAPGTTISSLGTCNSVSICTTL